MTNKEKNTIQDNVKRIENDNFNSNDLYMIYLGLRNHVNKDGFFYEKIFYELSNFVAHNDNRYKGITLSTFNDFYYVSSYLVNMITGMKIDLTSMFPSNIKTICLNKLDRMETKTVEKLFGENKVIIGKVIKKAIICNNENNAYIDKTAPKSVYNLIFELLNRVPVEPLFTDEDIINSFLKVLDLNKIKYNKVMLLKQKEKIILSLLVLIHHTEFISKLDCKIHCHIYYYIGTNKLTLNLGYLIPNNEWIGFMYEAITTNMSIYDYCSEEMLKRHNQDLIKKNGTVFNSELGLNSEFKLVEKKLDA